MSRSRVALGLLAAALLGFLAGLHRAARVEQQLRVAELARVVAGDLQSCLDGRRFAEVGPLFERVQAGRHVASVAWFDARGELREQVGDLSDPTRAPDAPGVGARSLPGGEAGWDAWARLPGGSWLRLTLRARHLSGWWALLPALLLLGVLMLPRRPPDPPPPAPPVPVEEAPSSD